MSAAIVSALPSYFTKGVPVATTFVTTGFDSPPTWSSSALPDGLSVDGAGNLTGIPTAGGFFTATVSAQGEVSTVPVALSQTINVIVEGDGWLNYFHPMLEGDELEPRPEIDLQYNVSAGTITSGAVNVANGIDLVFGRTTRIFALISRNGTRTLSDGTPLLPVTAPTAASFIVRAKDQFDSAAFVARHAADGDEDLAAIGGSTTRPAIYFDLTPNSARLRRLFRRLNAPSTAEAASAAIVCDGQLAFTLDGRRVTSPVFRVNIRQPFDR